MDLEAIGCLTTSRGIARDALSTISSGLPVKVVGDSDLVINQVMGRFAVSEDLRESCHACIALVTNLFETGVGAPAGDSLLQQIPREDNSTADALANQALDTGAAHWMNLMAWRDFVEKLAGAPDASFGLCVQFDGAARGNPCGPASWGMAVWYGTWSVSDFTAHDLLETHAEPIGVSSNNVAEYAGYKGTCQSRADGDILLQISSAGRASLRRST
eukprot:12399200-Karenia_brevis.AAC.1